MFDKIIKKIIKKFNINEENCKFDLERSSEIVNDVDHDYEILVSTIRNYINRFSLKEKGVVIFSTLSKVEYDYLQDKFRKYFDLDLNRTILTLLMSPHKEIKDAYNNL